MLNQLKTLLGITDESMDELLKLLISLAIMRLTVLLGGLEPTEELDYVVLGVCTKKYNRVGSEGLSSHTVEGESMTFTENDFAEYAEDIEIWLSKQKESTRGKVRFL